MIISETAVSCVTITSDPHSRGGLPINIGTFYKECAIVNYLDADLYAVDFNNKSTKIPRKELEMRIGRKVEIRSWYVSGKRTWSFVDGVQAETTPSNHEIMTIPYELIRSEPVFVEALNVVLCFADQLTIAQHPHSKESKDAEFKILYDEISKKIGDAPFVIIANDPKGSIKTLYVEVHGEICSVDVTHFKTSPDSVTIGLRNRDHPNYKFTSERTTFSELLRSNPRIWKIAGFTISSDKHWLLQTLDSDKVAPVPTVTSSEVNNLVDKIRREDASTIKRLSEALKESERRLSITEENVKILERGDYQELQAKIAKAKLEAEFEKLRQAKKDAENNREAERLKLKREIVATAGAVIKTIAVITPLAIGIYKAFQAIKSA